LDDLDHLGSTPRVNGVPRRPVHLEVGADDCAVSEGEDEGHPPSSRRANISTPQECHLTQRSATCAWVASLVAAYRLAIARLHNCGMSTATILSVIAIVLSALSLGWQALSWRWDGARLAGWLSIEDASPIGDALVVVHAINTGRSAATVTAVRAPVMRRGDVGSSSQERRLADSDPLPCRIEAGGHAAWKYPILTGLTPSESRTFRYADLRVVVTVNDRKNVTLKP
jgi:hypothetical protein